MQPVKQEWIAWLAGILDGEGHIGIAQAKRPENRYRHGVYHSPVVQIANTNPLMMERAADVIEAVTGFRPAINKKSDNTKNVDRHRQAWVLQLNAKAIALLVLSVVRPYLVAKGEQADLVMAFVRRHRRDPGQRRRPDIIDADQIDYARCRLLNQGSATRDEIALLERMAAPATTGAADESR